jgi:hypothetical protein
MINGYTYMNKHHIMKIISCTKITETKKLENVSANRKPSGKTVQSLDEVGEEVL